MPLEREPWLDFQEVLELPDDGIQSISFHRGGEPLHRIEIGEPPSVSIDGPELSHSELVITVRTHHPRERASVLVLFSSDDGSSWLPVAIDPPEGQVRIPIDRLPGGDNCFFRATATAELQSASADSGHFRLPQRRQRLVLGLPGAECPEHPGPVALRAYVDTRGLGPIDPAAIRWVSDLDGELGFGYALTADLSPGRHEITVTVADGNGGSISERGIIIVGG